MEGGGDRRGARSRSQPRLNPSAVMLPRMSGADREKERDGQLERRHVGEEVVRSPLDLVVQVVLELRDVGRVVAVWAVSHPTGGRAGQLPTFSGQALESEGPTDAGNEAVNLGRPRLGLNPVGRRRRVKGRVATLGDRGHGGRLGGRTEKVWPKGRSCWEGCRSAWGRRGWACNWLPGWRREVRKVTGASRRGRASRGGGGGGVESTRQRRRPLARPRGRPPFFETPRSRPSVGALARQTGAWTTTMNEGTCVEEPPGQTADEGKSLMRGVREISWATGQWYMEAGRKQGG